MPMKRTPPPTSLEKAKSDTNQSSAPVTDTDNESSGQVTSRPRARKRQLDDEMSLTMEDMKKSLETFKTQQIAILENISGIKVQNCEMIKSMELISVQYEEMKNRIMSMETERKTHLAYIQTLETKVENLERSQKQSCIEMRNIPVQKNETKLDLIQLVKKVGVATKNSVNETDIRDVFRTNPDKRGSRSIIVDFSSILIKERVLTSVKNHNRTNQSNKLNTTHLQLEGQSKPIYIVECLTQKARKLFYLAREFGMKNNFDFCWTAHGKVFLRQKVGAATHRIDNENDIGKLQSHLEKYVTPKWVTYTLHGYEINCRVFFGRWTQRSEHSKMDVNFVSPTYTALELNKTTVEYEDVEDPDAVTLLSILLVGIFLSLLIFVSAAGNILVCIAIYTDRGLRRIGNLFLASLAIADMLVAAAVMTFAGVNDLLGYWVFGEQFCDTWVACDVMCSTASILNLCAISLDRYIHIKDPLRYGRWVTRKVAIITIALIWLLAVLVSFLPISLGLHRPPPETTAPSTHPTCALVLTPTYAVVSSCISFILPCIVMISIYCRLYCYAQKHVKSIRAVTRTVQLPDNRTKSVRTRVHTHVHSSPYHVSDHKAAITVGIIMGVFLLCWVPFFCVNIVAAFCKTCIPDLAFKILTWLGYSNSAFNPIIYSIFNTEFREAFKKILTSKYPPCCGYQTVRANTPTRNDNFVTDYGTKTLVVRRSGSLGLSGVDPTPRSSAESVKPLREYHI